MPHKHKRKRGDDGDYELPPTQKARSLPTLSGKGRVTAKAASKRNGKSNATTTAVTTTKKPKSRSKDNDTPRAFRRLMAVAQGKKVRSGLDDGADKSKPSSAAVDVAPEAPRIQPGEDLRSFAARVNAALPVSGLTKKTKIRDGKDEQGLKVYRTIKERKMHKLYDQWRAEERKIQEKRDEQLELEVERELENDAAGILSSTAFKEESTEGGGKKKGRRRRGKPDEDKDEDPWLALKKRRGEVKIGLHDVAQAPPELHKKIRQPLRIGDAAVDVDNVPKAAGSLRRREELQVARNDIIDAYRKIREHEQAKLDGQRKKA
ncbi:urease accessory protein UreD [Drechmeria coniospora]|uniref:Urease accessory protein UreD n=1 Tax=Drechmeria coniospora TaxID=98403 RepID=A0A151GB20_DRECN|nr:urease accessory protein UreD [Drechmeria coniospora]KYK54298.1 urease accessory protein UreD [Drechmeria coniospora]ODA77411.1 hypothetical protein RJ55_07040 [Drechmeria coniospora]